MSLALNNWALDAKLQIKVGINIIFFLFLHENICCVYSLEVPQRGTSNEYNNIYFHGEIRENISTFQFKKAPYLELCLGTLTVICDIKAV